MSTCALIGAVDFNEKHFLSQHFDCVVAVDGGYASLMDVGYVPDFVVGDFDSLGFVPTGENVRRFPTDKDQSDMELAIECALKSGCETLLLYGALDGRLDHTIANVQLMVGCARRGMSVAGIGGAFVLAALDGMGQNKIGFSAFDPACLDGGSYGRFLSLFSYGGTAGGVVETGLKYSLQGRDVSDAASLCLSNEFTGLPVEVVIETGNALVTFSSEAWPYITCWPCA